MTREEQLAFSRGYLIACCNLDNLHDMPCVASDVLAEGGVTSADIRKMGLTEYDLKALRRIRKARNLDPINR